MARGDDGNGMNATTCVGHARACVCVSGVRCHVAFSLPHVGYRMRLVDT